MSNSFKIARIAGIDIFINWSWLIIFALLTWSLGGGLYYQKFPQWGIATDYLVAAISALLLFVTVLLHELGHSLTARAQGLPVHSITLFIFGGVSNLTREPESPKAELLVTVAGPLVSLALGGIFLGLHALIGAPGSAPRAVLGYLAWINLVLAVFNLIPGFPLDGGRILRSIAWLITGSFRRATRLASRVGEIIGFLFIVGGIFQAFELGSVLGGIWMAFIGWFLLNAAGTSYQQAIMRNLLSGVDVEDVMDPPSAPILPSLTVESLVYRYMLGENLRAVPVCAADGRLLGLVTLSDVTALPRERWSSTLAGQIMTPADRLLVLGPRQDLNAALHALAENDYHQLPVVRDARLVGMLDRSHVMQYLHLRQELQARAVPDRELDLDVPGKASRQAG